MVPMALGFSLEGQRSVWLAHKLLHGIKNTQTTRFFGLYNGMYVEIILIDLRLSVQRKPLLPQNFPRGRYVGACLAFGKTLFRHSPALVFPSSPSLVPPRLIQ